MVEIRYLVELANSIFQKENRVAEDEQCEEVWDQERGSVAMNQVSTDVGRAKGSWWRSIDRPNIRIHVAHGNRQRLPNPTALPIAEITNDVRELHRSDVGLLDCPSPAATVGGV